MASTPSFKNSPKEVSPLTEKKLRHSKLSKILVLVSGVILFLFLVVSFFLDKKVDFSEEIEIAVNPQQVVVAISDLRNWKNWSVWNEKYYRHQNSRMPTYQTNQENEAIRSIEEQQVDNGSQKQVFVVERKEKSPQKIVFWYFLWDGKDEKEIEKKSEKNSTPLMKAVSTFTITPKKNTTMVQWHYQGDYSSVIGLNPLQKYFLWFTEFSLKRAYRQSLASLKEKLEK